MAYETVLEQCKTLLGICNGLIMTGDWKSSTGCMEEHAYAVAKRMPIWESIEEFHADHTMPNDLCGRHHSCKRCLCRKCAERLACWNCNDCTKPVGKHPVGYTAKGVWECSRYRKKS